jgi:molecular chaperone GrpE
MADKNDAKVDVMDEVTPNEETLEETTLEEIQSQGEQELEETYIKELEGKVEEANNKFLRAQADLENFRRRARLEKEASEKYRSQKLLEDLVPVLDNFHRALAIEVTDEQSKSIIKGLEMVYRQLTEAVKKEGLEEIEAEGKQFDPHFHQAVMQVEDSAFESNVVVEELQKGYSLKDRVIRPSMVKVNQ